MEKQIKLFLEFLENDKKLSANTLQSYRRDIVQFQEYLDNEGLIYSKLGQQEIKDYIEHLKKIGKKKPPFTDGGNLKNGGGRWIAQGCQISFKICCNLQFFCRK